MLIKSTAYVEISLRMSTAYVVMKTIARKCSKITNFIARKCSNWYKMTEEAEKDLENVNKVNRICSNFVQHVNRICSNENHRPQM